MKQYYTSFLLWLGLCLSFSPLQSQTVNLDSFQDIQLMKNEFCAVIEVNASWNWKNKIGLEKIENCYTGYVDISNKEIFFNCFSVLEETNTDLDFHGRTFIEQRYMNEYTPNLNMRKAFLTRN